MSEEELDARFSDRSLLQGGERYFDLATALIYVDACTVVGLAVIGIEGFEQRGPALLPRLDLVADFSGLVSTSDWPHLMGEANRDARRFLEEFGEAQVLLCFVLLSRSEWEGARA